MWLEAGRDGQVFTYGLTADQPVLPGDLVRVRLRGRPLHGLVVATREANAHSVDAEKRGLAIEETVQREAVAPEWREWVESVAVRCHLSAFRTLKAALPAGWLGQARSLNEQVLWWVSIRQLDGGEEVSLTKRQQQLIDYLKVSGGGAWLRQLQAAGFSSSPLQALERNGLVQRQRRSAALAVGSTVDDLEASRVLTTEQRQVIEDFSAVAPGHGLLLWGITGSGKTEIYLQLAAKELQAGRHVLLLTPEIGLIPQLVDRCKRRFGSRVLEYHSGCSDRERLHTWRRCLRPEQPLLAVGTRSAVFLPLDPIGLIVLDEEHDASYKQDAPMPCYHARDLAIDRMQRAGGRVVLGSATPSLDSWVQLEPNGHLKLSRLRQRISQQSLPPVHVVDMRLELEDGHRRLISRPLMERLAALPEAG